MKFADMPLLGRHDMHAALAFAFALMVAGCGGGGSSVTTVSGGGATGLAAATVAVDAPTGDNTTEIVVDSGPSSFSLGVANIPYVTVTVCSPGSSTACVTIDHVFLDTGSVGFRVLKSALAGLSLPAVSVPADAASATVAGNAAECYPFVLGAMWGALARADVHIAGESAASLPVQIVDDSSAPSLAAPTDCVAAANGGLLNSVSSLKARAVLGVGTTTMDCGQDCVSGLPLSGHRVYYSCPPSGGAACTPAALPVALQMQNPVAHFALDNNGTLIMLPTLPDQGAAVARGRVVFGIGTQPNNQIPLTATMYLIDANPRSPTYGSITTTVGATNYPDSYIDSGSNALFFDDLTLPMTCAVSAGQTGGWFCPSTIVRRSATLTGADGTAGNIPFAIANADALFSASGSAFADLGGSAGQGATTFVWGLPFFYGRAVFTSIWGQSLSTNGPWYAF